ncbi:hypothetical protein [Clostridium botulinum]|uniref:hypothetical protein n=1 Tax=Clostridium botulinum TaxID=1491 RepID=UPI000B039A5B|nr:hypothetical protein [Clostridium botulinum]
MPVFLEATAGVITSDAVAPIMNAVTSNISTLLPVGIGIMAAMVGVGLIPRIVYKFL